MKKVIIGIVLILVIFVVGGLGFLTLTDYQPEAVESVTINTYTDAVASGSNEFSIMTWNIGYAGLGDQEDFFMDGGTNSRPKSKNVVEGYLNNILTTLKSTPVDFALIQEIDIESHRSYEINQFNAIERVYEGYDNDFALNYDVKFVPVPWPPMGKVKSGICTFSRYDITSAERYKFEGNYAWPKSTVMLDRCFTTSVIPLDDRAGDLILINAHFSAYDDGSLKEQQLKAIKDFVVPLYEAGHYVVLGGDWNQTFDTINTSEYPLFENGDYFNPSVIPSDWLNDGWQFGISDNAPTYRLLSGPYVKGDTQIGVIDGFLVSPNVQLNSVEVMDLEFKNSDHNPVIMQFQLKSTQ